VAAAVAAALAVTATATAKVEEPHSGLLAATAVPAGMAAELPVKAEP